MMGHVWTKDLQIEIAELRNILPFRALEGRLEVFTTADKCLSVETPPIGQLGMLIDGSSNSRADVTRFAGQGLGWLYGGDL